MKNTMIGIVVSFVICSVASAGGFAKVAEPEEIGFAVSVKEVVSDPHYLGHEVTITGSFKGGYSKIGPPPVTKSDFIVEDPTGQIFVTGSFPAGFRRTDIGKPITVRGMVKSGVLDYAGSKRDIVYLKAVKYGK